MSKELPRHDDGTLIEFTDLGGYPVYYYNNIHETLCPTCANIRDKAVDSDEPKLIASGVNYEDDEMYCQKCGKQIKSAYTQ